MNTITSNAVVQLNVVVIFLKEGPEVNKTKFAKERDMSRRTLDRWIAKYMDEAMKIIESEKAPKTSKNAAVTKRDIAAGIYSNGVTAKMKRSEIITAMVSGAGLTPAGASTYISNFKTGKWDV